MDAFVLGGGNICRIQGEVGKTPPCPAAKYAPGDVVLIRRNRAVGHFPERLVALVAVPPGFSPDYAIADLLNKPRPLMVRRGIRGISYIMVPPEGGPTSYNCPERHILRKVGEVEIGSISESE